MANVIMPQPKNDDLMGKLLPLAANAMLPGSGIVLDMAMNKGGDGPAPAVGNAMAGGGDAMQRKLAQLDQTRQAGAQV